MEVPEIVKKSSLNELTKIYIASEGDWNPTATIVWTRENGFVGFEKVTREHEEFKPSIELYFENYWIGLHCFKRIENKNVFDEELAKAIIEYVNKKISENT